MMLHNCDTCGALMGVPFPGGRALHFCSEQCEQVYEPKDEEEGEEE